MKHLLREVEANYQAFASTWYAELGRVYSSLQASDPIFLESYKRLVSLQAWRAEVLDGNISPESLGFFLESQNDGLVSLVLARLGSCRAALQSLRSCLENALQSMYYKDHPIELQLWKTGSHRLDFTELLNYLSSHPSVADIPPAINGLAEIKREYGMLSRAMRGSAVSFRMSGAEIGTQVWSEDASRVGMYRTSQKSVTIIVNQLLLCLFRQHLQGAAKPGLRKAVSLVIPTSKHAATKAALGVTLFQPS